MLYLSTDFNTPVEYCTSGKFICETGGAVHPDRNLDTFVLLFGCEGEYYIEQNGTEYHLVPGSFLLLFPHFDHRGTRPSSPGLSHYWCHFSIPGGYGLLDETKALPMIHTIRTDSTLKTYDFTGIPRTNPLILPEYGRVASTEKYRLLFRSLIDCSRSMHGYRSRLCDLITMQLLYELSGDFISLQKNNNNRKQQALTEKVVEFIRLNAINLKSVHEVADIFGYNPEYLSTFLKKNTGLSVMAHINRSKIEEAKKLLLSTNLTISEIAPLCGFSDVKYFSKLFHRLTDTTPSEYRNVYCKIHMNQ